MPGPPSAGIAVEAAVTASEGAAPPDRVRAFGEGFRSWVIAHPLRYLMLLDSPLPGYHAPADTVMAAPRDERRSGPMGSTRRWSTAPRSSP